MAENTPAAQLPSYIQSRGTEFLDAETEGPKSTQETFYCRQRPGNVENRRQDPRRNGLFSIDDSFRGSGRLDGGDHLDQTACSPRRDRTSLRTSSQERNFLLQRRERKIRRSAS
jgi:hypothetical protein